MKEKERDEEKKQREKCEELTNATDQSPIFKSPEDPKRENKLNIGDIGGDVMGQQPAKKLNETQRSLGMVWPLLLLKTPFLVPTTYFKFQL